jgi:ATP-binding cassette subfamily B protein
MRGPRAAGMFGQGPAEKSMNFTPSAKRLLRQIGPDKWLAIVGVFFTAVGVGLSVIGPRILGHATNLIFAGVIGKMFPAGLTKQQAIDAARAAGHGAQAGLMETLPGLRR